MYAIRSYYEVLGARETQGNYGGDEDHRDQENRRREKRVVSQPVAVLV